MHLKLPTFYGTFLALCTRLDVDDLKKCWNARGFTPKFLKLRNTGLNFGFKIVQQNFDDYGHDVQYMDRVKRIWYLLPMRAAKVQASLRIRAVSPEPPLLAHTSSESRGTFRQKARALAPLNGWACAVKICHDGMLEDTNSLDGAHMESK